MQDAIAYLGESHTNFGRGKNKPKMQSQVLFKTRSNAGTKSDKYLSLSRMCNQERSMTATGYVK